ncbi:MAG: FIST C-terminal domain-containing protein [Bacteroidia bacterium]|nr:FIST C-terminal domain-containing protein [Bacteroidia bacterium]
MKTIQVTCNAQGVWNKDVSATAIQPQLIVVFGATEFFKNPVVLDSLKNQFPDSVIIGGSTAGEIADTTVNDGTLVATLVEFEKSSVKFTSTEVGKAEDSFDAGVRLVSQLDSNGLRHIFVVSEGLQINGSELVRGIRSVLPPGITATGGLAGDGADFKETYVLGPNGKPFGKMVTAIGLYGESLKVGYGSLGGWDSFGVERMVTRSVNNILFELDGKPALELYKSFLGDHAANLPSSGLLFPLNMRVGKEDTPLVRTILAVNEADQSLTFAGDIPEGSYVRLMKANFDRLIDGAVGAAESTLTTDDLKNPDLAILISCVGRKLVLKQMIEEEVEGVSDVLGKETQLCGFYSYGEISPFKSGASCELHNQTMTITTLKE